jgi:putative aminopeptidase FrvX
VSRGPNINPHVHDRLVAAARREQIPVQIRGVPKATGTDANAIQLTRDGVAAGLVGIPNRYMHSPVEVVSLKDLDHAARLLAEFCTDATADLSWIP